MSKYTDARGVGTRVAAALPRAIVVVASCLLASGTISLAADVQVKPQRTQAAPVKTHPLVVPDVRGQVFVFAKGMLEDEGFGWQVEGGVHGFASNRVITQSPSPGTRLIDTGSPRITLELESTGTYPERGAPEDRSPYGSGVIMRVGRREHAAAHPEVRPPAFVSGAPSEPNGLSLPARARRLSAWIERHHSRTSANTDHWLSEHAWIVTGARFGWWGGADALAMLIRADHRAEKLWGVAAGNRRSAEQALRIVRARSR